MENRYCANDAHFMKLQTLLFVMFAATTFSPGVALCADAPTPEVSLLIYNFNEPFVSRAFAERLGRLVMLEKYADVVIASTAPGVEDKDDAWWVTFDVERWPQRMSQLQPLLATRITVCIRKKDAAILAVK